MPRALLFLGLLLLTSCTTLTALCRHMAPAQYAAAVEAYGAENVQLWRMLNKRPGRFLYHMQVKVRPGGAGTEWLWADNRPYTVFLERSHNPTCTPLKRVR